MKSTTETLSPTRVKLTIEVPFEDFKPDLDKAYKTIGSQITVPGFRKGKVPAAIVDQRIGRAAVLDEAINGAMPGWYNQAVVDAKVQPLSQPEIDLTKFVDGEDIEITAELDVRPTLELPDVSTIEITVADAVVTDEDVDEQLKGLRERFATFSEVERAAQEGDFVTIDLSAAKDGEPIEAAQAEGMPYTIGAARMLEGLDEALIGLSAGESKTFSTQLVGGELAGEDVDVTVALQGVKEQELPEADDEFAQTASEFDTIEELRADLVDRVTRGKRMEQANEARDAVLEAIIEKIDVPLPDALLAEELGSRRQQIEQQLAMAGIPFQQYLDDEFAQMASEFDTVDELRADLTDKVTRGKRMQQAAEARDLVLDEIVSQVDAPLPEGVVTEELTARRQQVEQQLSYAGRTLADYLDDQEQTEDEFEAELEKSVRDSLIAQFVLDQIVETEEIGIDDNELTQHIMRRAQQSGEDPNSFIQHIMEHNHVPEMMTEVLRGKALASLIEAAVVKDESGEPVELKTLRADGTYGDPADDAVDGADESVDG